MAVIVEEVTAVFLLLTLRPRVRVRVHGGPLQFNRF
jgi:hypothetical protein